MSPVTSPLPMQYLQRPDGRIGYDVAGSGPLVVCVPGMGDLRTVYRTLAPALVAAGYRVATLDLRGHGDSDATFDRYDDPATGADVLALVRQLGGPATLVGNSMGGAAAVWAAAQDPAAVDAVVLLGAFVRDLPMHPALAVPLRLALRLALVRPWGPAVWHSFHRRLYPSGGPADLAAHRAAIRASLRRPGRWKAFIATTRTSHDPVEALLDEVRAPVLVVMGEQDPDFPDPAAEAQWAAERLHGTVLLVPDAGHYPQAERPELVSPAVVEFLDRVVHRA